jgi:hypothetical protein
MLETRSVKGTDAELAAIDQLIDEHGRTDRPASVTRTEPGEKGPLRVEIGRRSWIVEADGKTRKERD